MLVVCSLFAASSGLVPGASLAHATWRVIWEDEAMLVVDKDAGLLTVPGRGANKADCLVARLQRQGYPEVEHVPHRLDRDTSGLIVIGRNARVHRALSVAFEERRVTKSYEALCLGWPEADCGEVDAPIGKVQLPGETHARMRVVSDLHPGGRSSLTRWRVLHRAEHPGSGLRWSRVELLPVSGRAHQLRLHQDLIGHPILGDELHGSAASRAAAPRLCLHAAQLELDHPVTGQRLVLECDSGFERLAIGEPQ
jgi:tRNA pseudouridine32 synthase/23S rRNA pseudouridine746 synthase